LLRLVEAMATHAPGAPLVSPTRSTPAATHGPAHGLARIVRTTADAAPLVARLTLGIVIFPHGAQKVLGWFGGHGLNATMSLFTAQMGIPAVFAALAIAAEFLGSIGLIVGALSRIAAFGIACVMATALALVNARVGFFMNWMGTQRGEGFEFHLLAIGLALVVMIAGAGRLSVDRWLTKRLPA
jgi:putative oxidoreductase